MTLAVCDKVYPSCLVIQKQLLSYKPRYCWCSLAVYIIDLMCGAIEFGALQDLCVITYNTLDIQPALHTLQYGAYITYLIGQVVNVYVDLRLLILMWVWQAPLSMCFTPAC